MKNEPVLRVLSLFLSNYITQLSSLRITVLFFLAHVSPLTLQLMVTVATSVRLDAS